MVLQEHEMDIDPNPVLPSPPLVIFYPIRECSTTLQRGPHFYLELITTVIY